MKPAFTTAIILTLLHLLPISIAAAANQPYPTPQQAVPIQQVHIEDEFWTPKIEVWRDVTIPDCFVKFENDGAFTNFDKVRDGSGGEHGGPPWYDGLIYEMIRASAQKKHRSRPFPRRGGPG